MRSVCLSLTLLMIAGSAAAQESGWRMGLSYGLASEDFDDTGGLDIDDGYTLGVQAAYTMFDKVTIEGELQRFDGFEVGGSETLFGSTVSFDGEVDGWILMASGKFYPLTGTFQPYVIGGLGYMDAEAEINASLGGLPLPSLSEDDSSLIWKLGLGLDHAVGEHWVAGVEATYNAPTGDLSDFKWWGLGLSLDYRF